jgi:hypothetical protein
VKDVHITVAHALAHNLPGTSRIVRPGIRETSWDNCVGKHREYFCQDCNQDNPGLFMLKDDVWASLGIDGIICIKCCGQLFKAKHGRPIGPNELKDLPINEPMKYAYHYRLQIRVADVN